MTLETERLLLRELTGNDYGALYRVLADSDIMQHYPYTFDEARVKGWITKNEERYRVFGFGLWAVCLKETGELIGDCGLTMQRVNGFVRPEIGYHLRGDMQRRGYAREAASAVRDWAFRNTPFRELCSYMAASNLPSARCAEAWGARLSDGYTDEDGTAVKVYAMTKAQWQTHGIVRLTERRDLKERAAAWFAEKWSVPEAAYRESMEASFSAAVPSWYLCMDGERIVGGMGVIENDFHDRPDLTPNVCAVYTEPAYRCRGIAGRLLDFVCADMAAKGFDTLYLLTDHVGFYERYGWRFCCTATTEGEEEPSRMYVHECAAAPEDGG